MSIMNPYMIPPLLAFLVNFFTIAYATALNIKNPVNRSYVLWATDVSLWVLCSIAYYLPLDESLIVPFSKFSSFFWYFMGFGFMNFTYVFIGRRRDLVYYSTLGISVLAIAVCLFTDLIVSGFSRYPWGWRFREGVLFNPASLLVIVMPVIASWVMTLRHRQSTTDPVQRNQITPLLAGVLISLVFAAANQYLLPNLPGFDKSLRYTAAWSVILSIFVFYTIVRHRFLTPGVSYIADELFASSIEGVVILNSTGAVLHINNAAATILNTGRARTSSLMIETLIDNYRTDRPYTNHQTTTAMPNWKRTVLVNQSVIRAGTMTIGWILIINDITEMARINEALRESNELFNLITGNVADIIWIFDLKTFKFSYASPSVTTVLGWSQDEFTSMKLSDHVAEEDLNRILKNIRDEIDHDVTRAPARTRGVSLKERTKDRGLIDVEINASFIRNASGEAIAILGVTRDVTRQKRLEKDLIESLLQLKERNETIEKDLKTAQIVQRALLPAGAPRCARLAIEYRYHPLEAVGGDFFNIQQLAEGGLSIFVSDVTGHGIAAALFLSLLKSISMAHLRKYSHDPSMYMASLNADIFENMHSYYVSGVYGIFQFDSGKQPVRLSVACGGHPPPIMHDSASGKARYLEIRGSMIGVRKDVVFPSLEMTLQAGDRVYFYTDGLPEMSDESNVYMGYDRFLDIVGRTGAMPLAGALDSIMAAANDFRGPQKIADDIVIIGVAVI